MSSSYIFQKKIIRHFGTGAMKESILWGRWCLPNFNSNCDQLLKGALADMDNHLCDGRSIKTSNTSDQKRINPWENPSLMVFVNMYGI